MRKGLRGSQTVFIEEIHYLGTIARLRDKTMSILRVISRLQTPLLSTYEFDFVTFPSIAWWEKRTEPALKNLGSDVK